ncbi:MAG TPA: ATP-binding protein [Myxococcaceae bacterium]|nr:ATP-binding protein [Myxococcaceae bacterium]
MPAENERKQEPENKVLLSDSEERFRLLIDSLQDYSVFPLSVDGRVSNWNLGAERLKGYSTEEALGMHISVFFPEQENAERVPERILKRAELEGRSEYEGWLLRKDKSQFWGSVVLNPMRDQDGRLRGFSNVARDLTERKRVEKAQALLAEAGEVLTGSLDFDRTLQEMAQLIVHSMADWCTVAVLNSSGLVMAAFAHVDQAREAQYRELLRVLPASEGKLAHGIGHVVRTGQPDLCTDTLEAAWVRAALGVDTPERLMELGARSYMCVPLTARGDTFGAITFVSVTPGRNYGRADLALAEELVRRAGLALDNARLFSRAQEALKARDEFLSMASHDLRSPLTSLRLQLQAVRKEMQQGGGPRSPDRLATRVESMVRQTDRMIHMMDALMDISQMTAGRLELKRQRLDLVELVRESVSTLDEELRQSGVEIRVQAQGPVEGSWDRLRLGQVVDNLLSNAVKYGKGRPVDLRVSTDGAMAKLVVSDQGVGIAPEDQERLFDRFERVRLNKDVVGHGVGLWIVRRVVEAHGGSVTVESRLGEGASFIVQLPARAQADREKDPEPRPAALH